jgi:hypothetical protein
MAFIGGWKLYELGIADVLRYKYAGLAQVETNVRLAGRYTRRRRRQVDVVVRRGGDDSDILVVVDCKLWRRKVDVRAVEGFLGFVRDIGAEVGILATEAGCTEDATHRIEEMPAMMIRVMTRAELLRWSPRGTVTATLEIDVDKRKEAEEALWSVNLRTRSVPLLHDQLEVHKNYGEYPPSTESQSLHLNAVRNVLSARGLRHRLMSHGIIVDGGTPDHTWVEVEPIGVRVLASNQAELEQQIERLRSSLIELGFPPHPLSAKPPVSWERLRDKLGLSDWRPPPTTRSSR